jgi:hypothetical protein
MRFVILSTLDWSACRDLAAGRMSEEEAGRRMTGCCWLLRAEASVDDPEEALREAAREFFASEEGRTVLDREEEGSPSWEAALRWIPDETWSRFGLEVVRHPDVQRVVLDRGENLAEPLSPGRS